MAAALMAAAADEEPEPASPAVVAALEGPLTGFTLSNFLPPSKPQTPLPPASNPALEEAFFSPKLAQGVKPAAKDQSSFLPRRR